MEIEVIILTMSSKHGGYCVAGIDMQTGKLVRLVSDKEYVDGALFDNDIRDVRGYFCKPLDVVRLKIIRKMPTVIQPENILVDSRYRWQIIASLSMADLENYLTNDYNYLFGNSSYSLSCNEAQQLNYSILMVNVNNLSIYLNEYNKTKARFWYKGNLYDNISVTDPNYYEDKDGVTFKNAVIVMSLANKPFNGQHYKFIAKVFV